MLVELIVSLFLLFGSAIALIGSIGLVKFPDFYTRLHTPTKATTLGVGGVLLASVVFFSTRGEGLSLHELLVSFFLFMTAPVSAHLLARAGKQVQLKLTSNTHISVRSSRWDDSTS
jgi:multicomponent K+:H+ antiporter subunit G